MKVINIGGISIPYNVTKKNNKNTYFYFKKDGYIQINLSRYQSVKDALKFIELNQSAFLKKYQKVISRTEVFTYSYKGVSYEVRDSNSFFIDHDKRIICTDHSEYHKKMLKEIEKKEMMRILSNLKKKYINNPYVDISRIKLNSRYTKSRHGSCNKTKQTININLYLIRYDIKFIEYVFLHEITHLVHANHQSEFYDLFGKLCPNYKILKRELREIYR